MSFLPQTNPGNLRDPVTTEYAGKTLRTLAPYERPSHYTDLRDESPTAEVVSMLLHIYDDSFSQRGIPTALDPDKYNSPAEHFSGNNAAPGQVGHSNYLRISVTLDQDGDDKFIVNWDESPNCKEYTLTEGSYTKYYVFNDMSPGSEAENEYGCYRQANPRFRPLHLNGRFTKIDLADQEADTDTDLSTFGTGYDYEANHFSSTSYQYSRGAQIVDLKVRLNDSDSLKRCNLELSFPNPLRHVEKLDIQNHANRPVHSGQDQNAEFYSGLNQLQDLVECPYFEENTGSYQNRYRTFYGCIKLTQIPESFADPDRKFIHKAVKNCQQMFEYCNSLRYLPNKLFTAFQDSPGHKLEYCFNFAYMFRYCNSLEFIPEIPFRDPPDVQGAVGTVGRTQSTSTFDNTGSGSHTRVQHMFRNCYNLRRVPDGFHIRDIWAGDTNSYSSATEAGLTQIFANCYNLADLNGFKLDDLPGSEDCSPQFPRRQAHYQMFTNMGMSSGIRKLPWIGSWRMLGMHYQDAIASGVNTATTGMNNDSYQSIYNTGYTDTDDKYKRIGFNVAYASDAGGHFGYSKLGDIKVRFIDESPVRWSSVGAVAAADKKDLTKYCINARGTSGQTTQAFSDFFRGSQYLSCIKLIGMNHWPMVNGEYEEMFEGCWRLRIIDGLDLSKANDSGDYNDTFNQCRNLERIGFGDIQDKCGTFDGSNDYIDTGFASTTFRPNDGSKDFSMSIVFDQDTISSTGASGRLIVPGNGSGTRGGLEVNSEGGTARAIFRVGGSAYRSDGTGTGATAVTMATGERYHVAATVDMTGTETGNVKLYVDGVLTHASDGISLGTASTTTVKIATQADAATNFFDGKIYDVRLYNSVLTADEVDDMHRNLIYKEYRKNEKTVDDNMVLHYTFEEGLFLTPSGTKVFDRSNHHGVRFTGINGTVSGATSAEFWANYPQLGPKYSITIDNSHLTPRSMVELFAALPTVSSKTLTISDNDYIDVLTDEEKEIATDKGWTLSLSGA